AALLGLFDVVGGFADPDSVAALWRARRRLALLRGVEAELRDDAKAARLKASEKEALTEAAESEYEGLLDVLRASGGDRLETAKREVRDATRRLTQVTRDRARFDELLTAVGATAGNAREFAGVNEEAHRTLEDPQAKSTARDAYAEARAVLRDLQAELSSLEAERTALSRRHDNIPSDLHEARDAMARAAGLTPQDLPFVGELIEVRTEFEPWREAFNLALGGFATTMLIDVAHLADFRAALEGLRTRTRVRYEGAHTGLDPQGHLDDRTLPGRLDYRPGPFTGWLREQLVKNFGYTCVNSPSELSTHRAALTISGQSTRGTRGAHGGHGRSGVLGFSNARRLAELGQRVEEVREALDRARDDAARSEVALDALDARLAALRSLCEFTWDQVDVGAVEAQVRRWNGVIEQVTAENPKIAEISRRVALVKEKAAGLREETGGAKDRRAQVEEAWGRTADEVDAAERTLEGAEESGRDLTPQQEAYLDQRFDPPADTDAAGGSTPPAPSLQLRRFDVALAGASQQLEEDRARAQKDLGEQRATLGRTLASFLERWPNPNLLADPDTSVGDFERILTDLESSGLHELESEWRDSLLRLSGNDLTNLDSTLGRSLREIRDRIEPINVIMQDLPFYDDTHRLQITTRENQSGLRQRFRRELREVRGLIDAARTEEEREQAYTRMARLIRRIRRTAPDFADLVDVRNYVRVSAERIDAATKEHVALYDHIGEKSGGESQELIAFIVGAALRYQLGDAGAERPRYAPVFLDEALIKADAHFTRRAIGAWRGLGFQLVIGAPNDKYSAIEPLVDVEYDILKDTLGRSWAKPKVGLPEQDA
ncbi:MAG: hypothetical protein L0H81_05940, partial [Actinomyces sp.]|nr:hypothetical protein [Actinomyces sp.]